MIDFGYDLSDIQDGVKCLRTPMEKCVFVVCCNSNSFSLNLNQVEHFVWPVLGPNCLQILSADAVSSQRVKTCYDRPGM